MTKALIQIKPFAPHEKRLLALDKSRLDAKQLVKGKPPRIEATHKRTERYPSHEARYYELQGIGNREQGAGEKLHPTPYALCPVFIQLNRGDPADDEQRLAAIAANILTTENTESTEVKKTEEKTLRPLRLCGEADS